MFLWEIIICCVFILIALTSLVIMYLSIKAEMLNPTPKLEDNCEISFSEVIEKQFKIEVNYER